MYCYIVPLPQHLRQGAGRTHLLLHLIFIEELGQLRLVLAESSEELVALHVRGGGRMAHLKEDDTQTVHVHLLHTA